MKILVYVTDNKERVISGDSLVLYMQQGDARKDCLVDLEKALKAQVVQLRNGDHLIIKSN